MKKNLLYTAIGLIGMMGTLSLGVVNAETTITYYTGSNISYTLNGNELFTGVGTITITDGTDTITILDRNLGATNAGTGCEDLSYPQEDCNSGDNTYGYYFQWGNNYGFNSNSIPTTSNVQILSENITLPYASSIFITEYSNWLNDNSKVDLWGGSFSDTTTFIKLTNEQAKLRRGPCPEGFHVPSIGELSKLVSFMTGANSSEKVEQMRNNLYIPFAGGCNYGDVSKFNLGGYANLWSSSPSSSPYLASYSQDLYMYYYGDLFYYSSTTNSRGNANSVRCFYDFYQPFIQSFTLNFIGSEGGSVSTGSIKAEEGNSITRDDEVGTVQIGDITVTATPDGGYTFSGWLTDCVSGTVTTGCSFTGEFKLSRYTITYELDNGVNSPNNVTGYTIEDTITFENPAKDGYTFGGWFSDAEFTTLITTVPTGTTGDITLYAKWTENKKPSGGSSGGGGRSSSKDVISNDSEKSSEQQAGSQEDSQPVGQASELAPQNDNSNTQDSQLVEQASTNASEGQTYTQEFQEAFEFAKGKGITTMPTIQQAKIDGKLTRIAMAKMLSYYAINVLGQKPDETRNNKFKDVTDKMDKDYDAGVTLAYQLGIMGINMPNNKFRPNDEVSRAEFATALSRMIYNTSDGEYKSTPKYYIHHMEKLVEEGIITNDDPNMKELRGYVMIMLKRSAK